MTLVGLANEANLPPISADSLYLRVVQMPRCGDLAILHNRQTKPITLPLALAGGVPGYMQASPVSLVINHPCPRDFICVTKILFIDSL